MTAAEARAAEAAWRQELGRDPRAPEVAPAPAGELDPLESLLAYGTAALRGTVRPGATVQA